MVVLHECTGRARCVNHRATGEQAKVCPVDRSELRAEFFYLQAAAQSAALLRTEFLCCRHQSVAY